MDTIIASRNWRYATKKFDPNKKVEGQDLDVLLEATRLSASSYGLQPYHVFVISNKELQKKLRPFSWNQAQITEASHLIVFANKVRFDGALVDNYLENVSETRSIPHDGLKDYGDFMKSKLLSLTDTDKGIWTAKQVYLALGNLLNAAAELRIDTCPIEGFEPEKYNEILGLDEKGLNATVAVALGYRSEDDVTQHYKKVRYSKEELFTHL
ncbi:MAG: NAD(P)H-dependent oxidoreductase [Bacteroidota bacterium]